jgi:hypothetical protein
MHNRYITSTHVHQLFTFFWFLLAIVDIYNRSTRYLTLEYLHVAKVDLARTNFQTPLTLPNGRWDVRYELYHCLNSSVSLPFLGVRYRLTFVDLVQSMSKHTRPWPCPSAFFVLLSIILYLRMELQHMPCRLSLVLFQLFPM